MAKQFSSVAMKVETFGITPKLAIKAYLNAELMVGDTVRP